MLSANEEHVEEYTLTSHAQEAIDYVKRLSGDRSMFSQSRIKTILEAARRCASDANPDREERVRRLEEQIQRLSAERDRIVGGGEIEVASDDRILEEYLNLRDLIAQLRLRGRERHGVPVPLRGRSHRVLDAVRAASGADLRERPRPAGLVEAPGHLVR